MAAWACMPPLAAPRACGVGLLALCRRSDSGPRFEAALELRPASAPASAAAAAAAAAAVAAAAAASCRLYSSLVAPG